MVYRCALEPKGMYAYGVFSSLLSCQWKCDSNDVENRQENCPWTVAEREGNATPLLVKCYKSMIFKAISP